MDPLPRDDTNSGGRPLDCMNLIYSYNTYWFDPPRSSLRSSHLPLRRVDDHCVGNFDAWYPQACEERVCASNVLTTEGKLSNLWSRNLTTDAVWLSEMHSPLLSALYFYTRIEDAIVLSHSRPKRQSLLTMTRQPDMP